MAELLTRSEQAAARLRLPEGNGRAQSLRARRYADLSQLVPASWAPQTLATVGIFCLLVFFTLYVARSILMPVVLAIFLSILFRPLVRLLARYRVPESAGAALVLGLLIALLSMGMGRLADPARAWLARAPESVPEIRARLSQLLRPATQVTQAAAQVGQMAQGAAQERKVQRVELQTPGLWGNVLAGTRNIFGGMLITFGLLYFLLASGDSFIRQWVESAATLSQKKRAVAISRTLASTLSKYLVTIKAINACLGLATGLLMARLGMPTPILWGVLGGLLNYVPYLGALIGVLIFGVVALLHFDAPGYALFAPLGYWGLTLFESSFVSPLLLGRQLALNPVMIFCSVVFWSWLWGIPGTLLAVPILMTLKILCDYSQPLKNLGRFLGR